jgi:SAM-dependent methyltransferase
MHSPDDVGRFVPAAGRSALNRWYDLGIRATMRESDWRPLIVEQIARREPASVVDVGCGTGTLSLALAQRLPNAVVEGVDGDPSILEQAKGKPGAQRVSWREALADSLLYDDKSVDAVACTLVLHHLSPAGKRAALDEMARVLRPGGLLVIGDWGAPHDALMRVAFFGLQCLDGFANTRDHAAGAVPGLIGDAGFERPQRLTRLRTVAGTFEVWCTARR